MNKKNRMFIIILITLLSLESVVQAQEVKIHVDDFKDTLLQFLISKGEALNYEEKSILFLTDLRYDKGFNLFNKLDDTIKLNYGIYSFGLMGPHFSNYLVIISERNTIIENYNLVFVLTALIDVYKLSTDIASEKYKITMTQNVLKVLMNRVLDEDLGHDTTEIKLKKY